MNISGWDWSAVALALALAAAHQMLVEKRWRRLCRAIESLQRRDPDGKEGEVTTP